MGQQFYYFGLNQYNCFITSMNFLPLRENIYNWTLQTDQHLFNQVSKMVQYIFEAQRNIGQSISATKTCLTQSSVLINNNFNHFLKLSQSKFTQNKIEQKRQVDEQIASKIEQESVQKSKMDILKEALNISIKNLQIKQNQNQNDNASVSEYSLSQAVFKNARLPPYFGSKQFRAKKYLDLFYDEDLIENQSRIHSQSFSNLPLSSPSQPNNNLAPPPSLDSLNSILPPPPPLLNNLSPPPLLNNLPPPPPLLNNMLPPPPSLNNLPPPPPLNNLPPPPPLINLSNPSLPINNSSLSLPLINNQNDMLPPLINKEVQNIQRIQNSQGANLDTTIKTHQPIKIVRSLTMQQQLALKLKHGKNYKAYLPQVISERENKEIIQSTQIKSNQNLNNQIIQSTRANRQSYRESANIDSFLGQNIKPFSKQNFEQQSIEQQQQNSLFATSKNKNKVVVPVPQKKIQKVQGYFLMSRSTFNEYILFKKKPTVSPVVKKAEQKKNVMFNNSDDQQDIFTKSKKKTEVKKVQKKPQAKTNKLFDNDEEEGLDILKISKKTKTEPKLITQQQAQKKQQVIIKKQPTKKTQKIVQKKKSLFQQEEDEEDLLKSFKKSTKKEKAVVTEVKKNQQKNPLISAIEQVDQPISEVKTAKVEQKKQSVMAKTLISNISPKVQDQTEQEKKKKRIAAMGFGLGPMMPKGMIITKPSQTKQQQRKAIQKQQELNIRRQKEQEQVQIRKAQKLEEQRLLEIQNNQNRQKQIAQIQQKQTQNTIKIKQELVENRSIEKKQNLQIKQAKKELLPPHKEIIEQVKIQKKIFAEQGQTSQTQLTLGRRKKGKPTKKLLFEDEEEEKTKTIVVNQIKQKAEVQKKVQVGQVKVIEKTQIKQQIHEQQIHQDDQEQAKRKRMQKIARMGGMGMMGMGGMGMGMMNPLTQGIKITKPSQAKIQQKLALQRLAEEQENKKKLEAENKKILEEEQHRKKIQQQSLAELRRIEKQKADKQLIRQQTLYQQEQKNAREKQIIRQQQEGQKRAYQQQQRQQQQRRRIEQQNRRVQQTRQQQIRIQRQRKAQQEKAQQQQRFKTEQQNRKKKVGLPIFNLPGDKNIQKNKIQQKKEQSFVPKLPQKTNPMGVPTISPLGNASSKQMSPISATNKIGSSNLPSIQSLSGQNKPKTMPKKTGLFDQDQNDNDDFGMKKKTPIQKKSKKTNGGLFDQDDDEDFGFNSKKKQQNKPKIGLNAPQQGKANLFGKQEDDQIIVSKKKQVVKVQVQQKKQVVPNQILQKPTNKNKTLFNQSDQDQPFSIKSKPKIALQNPTPTNISPLKKPQIVQKNIQQESQVFTKKPLTKSPIQASLVTKTQAPKISNPIINPLGKGQKKKTLFNNSDDDDQPVIKTQPKKQVQIKRQPIIESKTQAPKTSLFNNSDQEDQPKRNIQSDSISNKKVQISEPSQNKKTLFDSDQSQDQQAMRKKRQANKKLKKLI